jgi:hypothetical protein
MNLDAWADQVCRIRDLLQSSGISQGQNQKAQSIELIRSVTFKGDKEVWQWTAAYTRSAIALRRRIGDLPRRGERPSSWQLLGAKE